MRFKTFAAAAALTLAAGLAFATESTPGARAYFINLTNGQHVKSPVLIQFGLSGMGIAPAGSTNPGTGHHHLIIDADCRRPARLFSVTTATPSFPPVAHRHRFPPSPSV